jgi:hypothetical protein
MPFGRSNQSPDGSYLHLLQGVAFKPFFIMGNPRSGTTLLYNLLAQTGCFNFLTAYHVINYDKILFNFVNQKEAEAKEELDRYFKSLGINTRMFDEIAVSPDVPEEYGFVLRNAGYWYKLSSKSLPLFVEMCKKVQYVSHGERPLLLKSPLDFPNFLFLKSKFPELKFVFIHRYPINMINSIVKAVRHSLETLNPVYALIQKEYRDIFRNPVKLFLARFFVSSHLQLGLRIHTRYYAGTVKYFLKNIDSLPEDDYISVRYEDLCSDPETNMARILAFLQAEPCVALNYAELIQPRQVKLLEEVERNQKSISERFKDYLAYCKYDYIEI